MSEHKIHWDILAAAGSEAPGTRLDIATVALSLAALDREHVDLVPYQNHLDDVCGTVARMGQDVQDAEEAAQILGSALSRKFDYHGDRDTYDDPKNADLISVIDRRKGLPVTLSILYLCAARSQGWRAEGINFPGHFVLKLALGGTDLLFDPFNDGRPVTRAHLERILKQTMGEKAELQSSFFNVLDDRSILIRLLNNQKVRAQRNGNLTRTLDLIERMVAIAPSADAIWLELGQLRFKAGQQEMAEEAVHRAILEAGSETAQQRAVATLQTIRAQKV